MTRGHGQGGRADVCRLAARPCSTAKLAVTKCLAEWVPHCPHDHSCAFSRARNHSVFAAGPRAEMPLRMVAPVRPQRRRVAPSCGRVSVGGRRASLLWQPESAWSPSTGSSSDSPGTDPICAEVCHPDYPCNPVTQTACRVGRCTSDLADGPPDPRHAVSPIARPPVRNSKVKRAHIRTSASPAHGGSGGRSGYGHRTWALSGS